MTDLRAFTMPKWGIEMTEGVLAEWMVREGDAFRRGQTLCLIETDKITNEVEAEYDAMVHRIIVTAGGTAEAVGTLLAVFGDAAVSPAEIDAFISSFKAADTRVAARRTEPVTKMAPITTPNISTNRPISPEALKLARQRGIDLTQVSGSGRQGRITFQDVDQASRPVPVRRLSGPLTLPAASGHFASPLAHRLAALHGVDLSTISGTGPRGRISKADVLAALSGPDSLAENTPHIVPMDKVRKIIAHRLTEAKQHIPHFYLRTSAAVDQLLTLRKTANLVMGVKASINDYLIRAVALALVRHPDVNIQVHGDAIHHFHHADIAIAVAAPSGLVTPVVRAADTRRISDIASITSTLIARAQAGRLGYADLEGGSFSISNLGMHGIEQFDAIINPPQGAILAIGAIRRLFTEQPDGPPRFEGRLALNLSCDHRAIDGATGAAFLATLKSLIETPENLLG